MNTKLGLHIGTGSRNGYGKTAPLARGIVVFDDGGSMDEVHDDCFRLFRPSGIYEWPPGSGDSLDDIMPGFDQLSMEDMPGQAAYWWPIFRAEIDRVTAANGRIDATQITNEAGGNEPFQLRKKYLYEKHMGILAAADGYVITVGNEAVNSPDWTNYLWQSTTAPHVVEMWALGHIYCRHAYADKVDGVSRLIVNGEPAGQGSERPFKEIEFFKSQYGQCGPIILGEIGFVSYPGDDLFMQEITAYDAYMQQWPEIGYGAIFEYGDWNNGKANIQTASDSLAVYLAANPFTKWEPTTTVQPPEPPTGNNCGKTPNIKRVVHLLPQDMQWAEFLQVGQDFFANRNSYCYSHDDAIVIETAGDGRSIVYVWEPERRNQADLDAMGKCGVTWEGRYFDEEVKPDLPPVVGETVNITDYLMGIDGRQFDLDYGTGTQTTMISHQIGGGGFLYVKGNNGEYERLWVAEHKGEQWIFRADDTSESSTRMYAHYMSEYGALGAPWIPCNPVIGWWYDTTKWVQHYNKADCAKLNGGRVVDKIRLISKPYNRTYSTGKTLQVITLEWSSGEQYDFSGGNVGFRDATRNFEFMGWLEGRKPLVPKKYPCFGW